MIGLHLILYEQYILLSCFLFSLTYHLNQCFVITIRKTGARYYIVVKDIRIIFLVSCLMKFKNAALLYVTNLNLHSFP